MAFTSPTKSSAGTVRSRGDPRVHLSCRAGLGGRCHSPCPPSARIVLRVIVFDKRGTGMSDRTERLPDIDRRMLDIEAVMHAAGSEEAALFAVSEGGPMALLFAAAHPERTRGLVLVNTYARITACPDYPIGIPTEQL